MRAALPLVALLALAAGGCSDSGLSPSAERGRQVYLAQCTACHAKVLHGAYPPGYTPKRPTKVMVPLPAVAPEIAALADFLR